MKNLWEECKKRFSEEGHGNGINYAIICQASALGNPQSNDVYIPPLNQPLVNFLRQADKEGYEVYLSSMLPDSTSFSLKCRGVDVENLPFKITAHTKLLQDGVLGRKGLVIADRIRKSQDDRPLVYWNPFDEEVQGFLQETFGDNYPLPPLDTHSL